MLAARRCRPSARLIERMTNADGDPGVRFAYMTQRCGSEIADFWRRASDSCPEESEAEALRESARHSESVSALAAKHWPIRDMFDALPLVDQVAGHARSIFDPSRAPAEADLLAYAGRTHAAGPVTLPLGPDFSEFQALVIAPYPQSTSRSRSAYRPIGDISLMPGRT